MAVIHSRPWQTGSPAPSALEHLGTDTFRQYPEAAEALICRAGKVRGRRRKDGAALFAMLVLISRKYSSLRVSVLGWEVLHEKHGCLKANRL